MLANVEGLSLRARPLSRPGASGRYGVDGDDSDEETRPWRCRFRIMGLGFHKMSRDSAVRVALFLFLLAAVYITFARLPVDKALPDSLSLLYIKGFLAMDQEGPRTLGSTGSMFLSKDVTCICRRICVILSSIETRISIQLPSSKLKAVTYIPLSVLAVPASVLTLGGGYLFGLPVGFIADSIGSTLGATAAFILGRTIGRSYVLSKLKNYPKFQAVAIAIENSGFKIVLLLRLVPLLPFNILNYLLSVTPVHIGEYMLATWLGMMPITFALVYVGTTLKDLSDIRQGWTETSTSHWAYMIMGFGISVILLVWVTRIAKASLDKALAEYSQLDSVLVPAMLPIVGDTTSDLPNPLIIKIDSSFREEHQM
ncbi:Transmembrane protein [Senna tora]|uniref:Transmembrane protein n=1 Tax=Senna tora TaxID=362788 RepID=A0A834WGB8_9FABA|nr:Transmembrane protein [Senna tora]